MLSAIYDATGLLLILGEPGSGKTTTLLDLARTLLERARDDIKERVPVVLNLSSWKKKQPLAEWISGELSEKYRVPRKIARFWFQRDYLLPLLDGLDEVETVMQPDCVAAINAFIEEYQAVRTRGLLSAQRVSLAPQTSETERSHLHRTVKFRRSEQIFHTGWIEVGDASSGGRYRPSITGVGTDTADAQHHEPGLSGSRK